nr:MAG TPA: replisome organizer [Caudoviricetes sp.]
MAERRCFCMSIVDSDAFMEMPLSTQCFYFHLGMRADDYGFVNNPRRIAKLVGASDDDFKLLVSKRFLLLFDNGVVVIKHWLMHNTVKNDRIKLPQYPDIAAKIFIKQNKSYTEVPQGECTTLLQAIESGWKPLGTQLETTWNPKRKEEKGKEKKRKEMKRNEMKRNEMKIEEENKEEGFSPEAVEKLKTSLSYQLSFLKISDAQLSELEKQMPFEQMEQYTTKLSEWKRAHPNAPTRDYDIIAKWATEDGYEH